MDGLSQEQWRRTSATIWWQAARKVAQTVTFQDPLEGSFQVHIDGYAEHALDLHAQQVALATGGRSRIRISLALN